MHLTTLWLKCQQLSSLSFQIKSHYQFYPLFNMRFLDLLCQEHKVLIYHLIHCFSLFFFCWAEEGINYSLVWQSLKQNETNKIENKLDTKSTLKSASLLTVRVFLASCFVTLLLSWKDSWFLRVSHSLSCLSLIQFLMDSFFTKSSNKIDLLDL